jgi:hypothetical protein
MLSKRILAHVYPVIFFALVSLSLKAQSTGNSSAVTGTVLDPTGAVVANATIEIHNPVSGYNRPTTTDSAGKFSFNNVPFNPYHLSVTAEGFAAYAQDTDLRSSVSHGSDYPHAGGGFTIRRESPHAICLI